MCLPKSTPPRRITTPPPFTRTSALMTKSPVSKLHGSLGSKPPASRVKPAHLVSAVIALTVQSAMAAAAHRVDASAMTSVRRVARVRTSPSASITPQ